jgi:hypothetical protein
MIEAGLPTSFSGWLIFVVVTILLSLFANFLTDPIRSLGGIASKRILNFLSFGRRSFWNRIYREAGEGRSQSSAIYLIFIAAVISSGWLVWTSYNAYRYQTYDQAAEMQAFMTDLMSDMKKKEETYKNIPKERQQEIAMKEFYEFQKRVEDQNKKSQIKFDFVTIASASLLTLMLFYGYVRHFYIVTVSDNFHRAIRILKTEPNAPIDLWSRRFSLMQTQDDYFSLIDEIANFCQGCGMENPIQKRF